MNYFDKDRPKIGDRPALVQAGRVVCAIPDVHFLPVTDKCADSYSTYTAEVCILIAPNTGRWLSKLCSDPTELMERFIKDPEETLRRYFDWIYTPNASRESRSLSFEELGDLE